jgi:hypothetical protein
MSSILQMVDYGYFMAYTRQNIHASILLDICPINIDELVKSRPLGHCEERSDEAI